MATPLYTFKVCEMTKEERNSEIIKTHYIAKNSGEVYSLTEPDPTRPSVSEFVWVLRYELYDWESGEWKSGEDEFEGTWEEVADHILPEIYMELLARNVEVSVKFA